MFDQLAGPSEKFNDYNSDGVLRRHNLLGPIGAIGAGAIALLRR